MPVPSFSASTPRQLGQILRGFRTSQGLTQAEVAQRGGLLQKTVSKIESNPAQVSFESFYRLVSALNLDLSLKPKAASKSEW